MQDKLGDKVRVLHILEAISEIESYTKGASIEDFIKNSMMRFATIKQIEIIGEAANKLSKDLIETNPAVEWRKIIGMRHILVHEYFGIDEKIIWQIVKHDLPKLKNQAEKLLITLS